MRDGSADQTLPAAELKDLVKRKLVSYTTIKAYRIIKGPEFSKGTAKEVAVLTAEMLQSGAWKTANFKKYNFNARGALPDGGHLHPLLKVREQFRNIFLEMGCGRGVLPALMAARSYAAAQLLRNADQQLCRELLLEL